MGPRHIETCGAFWSIVLAQGAVGKAGGASECGEAKPARAGAMPRVAGGVPLV